MEVLDQLAADLGNHPDFPHGNYRGAPYVNRENEWPFIAALRTGLANCADVLLIVDPEDIPQLEADPPARAAALAEALHTARRKCGLVPAE
jgi:hypothetical protein